MIHDRDDVDEDTPSGQDVAGSTLNHTSVLEITSVRRSAHLASMIQSLHEFGTMEEKNAITKDDPEHAFLTECSRLVWKIEQDKTTVHRFLQDHYSIRFPELPKLVIDGLQLVKAIRCIGNNLNDLSDVVEKLCDFLPSHVVAVLIACASTTSGTPLSDLGPIVEACNEMDALEAAKQAFLEHIQLRMPLIAPNLCSFLGTPVVSQIFTLCTSVASIASLDPADLATLGAVRHGRGGVDLRLGGFVSGADLIRAHPPEVRPKALRLVTMKAIELARVDESRRASDDAMGLQMRHEVKNKMIQWTDPAYFKGNSNTTYDRTKQRRGQPKRTRM